MYKFVAVHGYETEAVMKNRLLPTDLLLTAAVKGNVYLGPESYLTLTAAMLLSCCPWS